MKRVLGKKKKWKFATSALPFCCTQNDLKTFALTLDRKCVSREFLNLALAFWF